VQNSQTRIYAAVEAAKKFLREFRVADDTLGEKRYASLVFFGTSADVVVGWRDITNCEDSDAAFAGFISSLNPAMTLQYGTFTQGGLLVARNLFSNANAPQVDGSLIDNRFVVLLTDGDPNCRVNGAANISTYVSGYTNTSIPSTVTTIPDQVNQAFADNRPATEAAASQIISGVAGQTYSAELFTIAFQTGSGFTPSGTTYPSADVWLRDSVASGPAYAYYADNTLALSIAFENIIEIIRTMTLVWHVYDPMAGNVMFLGAVRDNGTLADGVIDNSDGRNTFAFDSSTDTITWDLLTSQTFSSDAEQKVYKFTYKVRLNNIEDVCYGNSTEGVDTNLKTYLLYLLAKEDGATGELIYSGMPKEAGFKIPKVRSFKGDLSFTKVDQFENILSKAFVFTLTHAEDCPCGINAVYTVNATNDDGQVDFNSVPSGHKYLLTETGNPVTTLYETIPAAIPVSVSYGDIICEIEDGNLVNNAKDVPVDLWKYFSNADLSLFGADGELACNLHVHVPECYDESVVCGLIGTNEATVEYCEGGDVIGKETVFVECDCPMAEEISTRVCEGGCELFVPHDCDSLGCEAGCPGGDYVPCDGNCLITETALVVNHVDGCQGGQWEEVDVVCNGECVIGTGTKIHVCTPECKLVCGEPTHIHSPACYENSDVLKDAYKFTFTITAAGSGWTDTRDLTLTREMILDLLDPASGAFLKPMVINGFFTIPAEELNNGPFTVTESTGELGWTIPPSALVKLDNVTTGPVTSLFNNEYGKVKRPWFLISKELGVGRGSNSDTFYFELYDEDDILIKAITVPKSDGYKALVALDDTFLNADERTLTLMEVIPGVPTPGMDYDTTVFTITINDGVAGIQEVQGKTAEFFNYYFEPIAPGFTIQKTTNSGNNGTFTFDYTYEGSIWGVGFEDSVAGSGSVTLNTAADGFLAEVKLSSLTNFNGSITIRERSGTAGSRWRYDQTVYLLRFEAGVLTEKLANEKPVEALTDVVGFTNTYTSSSNTTTTSRTTTPDTDPDPVSEITEVPDYPPPLEGEHDLPGEVTEEITARETDLTDGVTVPLSSMPKTGILGDMLTVWECLLYISVLGLATLIFTIWKVKKIAKEK